MSDPTTQRRTVPSSWLAWPRAVVLLPALAACLFLAALGEQSFERTILALAVATLVAARIEGAATRRLAELRSWAARVARGERATPPLTAGRPDAIDALTATLREMTASLHRSIDDLAAERNSLEAILAAMVEGVLVLDRAGRILRANARSLENFGIAADAEVTGARLWDVCRDPGVAAAMADAVGSGLPTARDVVLAAPDERALRVNVAPVSAGSAWVLVSHDVTETRRLERMRTDLVANVSHELRTPLTAIKGFAETLLTSGFEDVDRARHFVAIIDRQAERVTRLLADLLTLSDLELGRTEMRVESVSAVEVIREVTDYLAEAARRAGVRVETSASPALRVRGDADRLAQVLSNLLDNAIKYSPRGTVVEVRAQESETRGWVDLLVIDRGSGIPADELPRVTERFHRVDKARSRELGGTGLGLAIVKHIVQAHGGSLLIQSELGRGTCVTVRLPSASSDAVPES